ncbi:PH domain-containing protein [Microbulbifer sp. 2201CG32-9]|uniref:PH domain-containing protein n=1 Tax=Microbulbifer sp. 2201CG32-9 TaxID=3232309 RepID=UPI00345B9ED3
MPSTVFQAPWGRQLKWISALSAALLLAIPAFLMVEAPDTPSLLHRIAVALPPAILVLGALFAIRGYAIQNNTLTILRPGWKTRIPLQGLVETRVDPQAMKGATRLFGNNGLFGYIGLFQSDRLGRFRAFATDPDKAVVLRFTGRTLVITPDKPERLVEILRQQL